MIKLAKMNEKIFHAGFEWKVIGWNEEFVSLKREDSEYEYTKTVSIKDLK